MDSIRTVELFAGVGGFRLGLEAASNIFKVISWSFGETKEYIIELKSKELEEIVEEQTTDTILELFDNYEIPDFIIDELYCFILSIIYSFIYYFLFLLNLIVN